MLIICQVCNENLGLGEHVCNPDKIIENINYLKKSASDSENKLSEISNAVFMVLQGLPSLEGESIPVSGEWLRRLWDAVEGRWYYAKDAETFIVHDLAKQNILCAAYNLFRSKNKTLLEKLTDLRDRCVYSKKALGYTNSSEFDITPEDIIKGTKC